MRKLLVLHKEDNVGVALIDMDAGTTVPLEDGSSLTLVNRLRFGHKVAIQDIPCGGFVIKYGTPIGKATQPIRKGEHVHVHNVADVAELKSLSRG